MVSENEIDLRLLQLIESGVDLNDMELASLVQDEEAISALHDALCMKQAVSRKAALQQPDKLLIDEEWDKLKAKLLVAVSPDIEKEDGVETPTSLVDGDCKREWPGMIWLVMSVAASVLFIFGMTYWRSDLVKSTNESVAYEVAQDAPKTPILTNSYGHKIALTGKGQDISALGSTSARNRLLKKLGYDINHIQTEEYTITVPAGKSYDIILADDTKVWLYADSKLTYPVNFKGNERVVYLQGQAHFEVTKDASHPFVIITDMVDARVLGTELNVSCYPGESGHVALLTGMVEIMGRKQKKAMRLKPGQGAVMTESGAYSVAEENMESYLCWKNGYLYFDDETLENIAKALGRWYNVKMIFDNPDIKEHHLRFYCMRNEPITRALELLNHYGTFKATYHDGAVHFR